MPQTITYRQSIVVFLMAALSIAMPMKSLATNGYSSNKEYGTEYAFILRGDSAFNKKDFINASECYQNALGMQKEAIILGKIDYNDLSALYYNLGNCYYRLKDYPHAVLAYQRALHYDPANQDASYNLKLTQAKLNDRYEAPSEMFFITWIRNLTTSHSAEFWFRWSFMLLSICLIAFLFYFFLSNLHLRQAAFSISLATILLSLASGSCGIYQLHEFHHCRLAVVTHSAQAYNMPSTTSKKTTVFNVGTTLRIVDSDIDKWAQVQAPDGKMSWVQEANFEYVKK